MSKDVEILDLIRKAFAADRMAQAYILAGNPRQGGLVLAGEILRLLFCAGEGCSESVRCSGCRQIANRSHPDVRWVEPQKRSRIISIEQVRELLQHMQQTAFVGGWKACVFTAADRLGPEASNALLKTLEEPSGRTLYLLLTDSPQTLLPTIRSRCQTVRLPDVMAVENAWTARLLEILREGDAGGERSVIAEFAQTDLIKKLFDTMRVEAEAEVRAEADEASAEDDKDTLEARASARYREWRADVMRALLVWFRDVLLLSRGADVDAIYFKDHVDVLRARASRLSRRQAMLNVDVVDDMHRQLERNLPEPVVFGYGLGRLG